MRWYFRRWGFKVGRLNVCWLDQWTGSHGLEIGWRTRALLTIGFRGLEP